VTMPEITDPFAHAVVLNEISHERVHQERLQRTGKFDFTCADPKVASLAKLPVLIEEAGEVAKELIERNGGTQHLYEELVQVAVVSGAWAESLVPSLRPDDRSMPRIRRSTDDPPAEPTDIYEFRQ
jgi:NTP pyrophosphatase (non-canonical NTP hydrolase)